MIRPPRLTFTTGPHREVWEKISQSEPFLAACDAAFQAYAEEIHDPLDATAGARIIGARRVLDLLKTIHEKTEPPKPTKRDSLNYETDNRRP